MEILMVDAQRSATSLIACSINSRSYNQKPAYDAKWSSTITLFLPGVSLMFFARLFKANPFSASCFLKGSLLGFRSAAPAHYAFMYVY